MSGRHAHPQQILYLVQGDYHGIKTWYYVLVDKLRLPLLQKSAMAKSIEEIERFGQVVYSGWGQTPPDYVRLKMESLYS